MSALILPAFVNAHTHLGDSAAYPAPKGTVAEIVGPPNGYKHRILRAKSAEEKISGMRSALAVARDSGTSMVADFREEGVDGIGLLKKATGDELPRAVIFGRPTRFEPTVDEIDSILRECDGLGLSATRDWSEEVLIDLSRRARSAGKKFAVHASEDSREDIDFILSLRPDFLVHMCHATSEDLEACKDADLPVVVCPSSNHFFGLDPGIPRLLKAGIDVGLGTDNGMISPPNMLAELKVAYRLSNTSARATPTEIVGLAVFGGRKVLNVDPQITTEISEDTDLVTIRVSGQDPLRDLVTRAGPHDIIATAQGGKLRRTSDWTR